jgi:hypothetical protein
LSLGVHVFVSDRPRMRPAVVPIVRNASLRGIPPAPTPEIPHISSVVAWSPQRKALILENLDREMTDGYASPGLYWALASPLDSQPTKVRLRLPTP